MQLIPVRSVLALLILTAVPLVTLHAQRPISEDEVEKWIAEQNQCGDDLDRIHIIKLDAVDFTHDGRPQAIVVAMSCNTGTAGPDVQSVLSRGIGGELIELGPPPVDGKIIDNAPLFGPGNVDLDSENGLLVLKYTDSTERERPFVIKYKWNGKQFEQVAVESSKSFPTSYDCKKAAEDVERAICYVKSLADLDLEMDTIYKKLLSRASASGRTSLREEQRKWLTARDAECHVENNKWFVDCLHASYNKRIAELLKESSPLTNPQ